MDPEEWCPIEDFENYEVSNKGRIRNATSLHCLGIYDNGHGVLQVVMFKEGKAYARAVHKMVAHAFLESMGEDMVAFRIDGSSAAVENLTWRPYHISNKLSRQRKKTTPMARRPILDLETEEIYDNSLDCANALLILEEVVVGQAQRRINGDPYGRFQFYYS